MDEQERRIWELKAWTWHEIARLHPEIKPEFFSFDDPYMLSEIIVRNTYRYTPKPGDLVMDIGANVGVFTAKCAIGGATVVAFEPHRDAFRVLCDTVGRIRNQGYSNILVKEYPLAIWKHRGMCEFYPGEMSANTNPGQTWNAYNGAVLTPDAPGPAYQACITLADAVEGFEWDCVKMDVEGAEFDILLGAPDETLQRIKYLTLELHNGWAYKAKHDALIERLRKVFDIDGTPDGDPRFAGEERFISVYATRKVTA